jgi:C4-dicarboxylate-specific signal transduction histidine kinase
MIHSDQDGLRQVLINVLLNAAEATPAGKQGRIQVRWVGSAKQLAIMIEDEGSGIGERDPEELFQPFITSKTRGTGLGLAVSRQIVESLGGSIKLANRQGAGARCTIQLPINH